jgi:dolichol-phosphate mannosyltransferase
MTQPRYNFSISVVIPVYNDEAVLPELHRRLRAVLDALTSESEMLFIEDGSRDGSMTVLLDLHRRDASVKIIQLARNFGQADAVAAGLDHAGGEVVILMDSDLQDRPEDIEKLLDALQTHNVPVAIARWTTRRDDFLKVATSRLFNVLMNKISDIRFAPRARVFRALRRDALEILRRFPERTATSLSLLYWAGCDYVLVDLERDHRYAGSSGYTPRKLLRLAADRIFSHSLLPIRAAFLPGILLICAGIAAATVFVVRGLSPATEGSLWALSVACLLFLLGLNFIFLGVIGEYLGRIYDEVRKRPKYVVKETYPKDLQMRKP